ncbi:MAG: hypothetical protein IJQ46_04500 [Oscillospiraceae bacterium]|nr:hypothetical protein [Oscillospiraceae bacterium]
MAKGNGKLCVGAGLCSARGRAIDEKRAEQSPAPTDNILPLAKPTIPFIIIAAGQGGRDLKRLYGMMDAFRNGRALLNSCAPLAHLILAMQNIYFIYQMTVV